jgi:glycosyltransferase involved in cell wall biosynthesis
MKILYVITGLGQGGAERVVCDLADEMFVRGHTVKIAYLTGEVLTKPIHQEINLIKVGLKSLVSLPIAYLKLANIIKGYQPDVVHAHMVHANLLTRLVRIVTPIDKLVCTAHNSNEGGILRMLTYRATHKLATITTNVSQQATLAFENKHAVPSNGMRTIYNGINLNKFNYDPAARHTLIKELEVDDSCRLILAVGRFDEQKDYPNLLNAIHLLKKEVDYPFKLLIAGDGPLREQIEDTIDNLELKDEAILLGRRDDIPKLMSAADLFILPSKFEGFGLVVAEAMACECLVVATDCGGVAEVLNNPEFLVPVNNAKSLMQKIAYALKLDKDRKSAIVYQNLKHVQDNFSLENIIEKWIALYHDK